MSLKLLAYKLILRATVRRGFSRFNEAGQIQRFFGKLDRRMNGWPKRIAAVDETEFGDLPVHVITPLSGHGDLVILYLHGGAFIARTPRTHANFLASLCQRVGARGFMPDYGLLPQHPFPKAQQDCEDAYRYLLDDGIDPANIILAGDSAGGFLCMSTLHRVRAAGLPMPRAVVLLSPGGVIRMEERGSAQTNARRDDMFGEHTMEKLFDMIMPSYADGPDYHPLECDLSGLPPMLVEVGDTEVLLDDSLILAERVRAAGGDVELEVTAGAPHVMPLLPVREAREATDRIASFIWRHTRREKP